MPIFFGIQFYRKLHEGQKTEEFIYVKVPMADYHATRSDELRKIEQKLTDGRTLMKQLYGKIAELDKAVLMLKAENVCKIKDIEADIMLLQSDQEALHKEASHWKFKACTYDGFGWYLRLTLFLVVPTAKIRPKPKEKNESPHGITFIDGSPSDTTPRIKSGRINVGLKIGNSSRYP